MSEGARPLGGQQRYIQPGDEFGPGRLGGIGALVGERLAEQSGHETRVIVLGHLQRGGSPTPFDRVLATRYGAAAVRLIDEHQFGHMVALKGQEIVPVPLVHCVGRLKTVPPDGDLVRTAKGMGISFADA